MESTPEAEVVEKTEKIYTLEELKQHKDAKSLWIAISDTVYDVTAFMEEHPGGEEVLLEQAGGYGTDAFEDVGHSVDARELMKKYAIGKLAEADRETKGSKQKKSSGAPADESGSWMGWLIPLVIATAATFAYKFFIAGSSDASV